MTKTCPNWALFRLLKMFWKVDVKNEEFSNSRFEAQLWPKKYLGIKLTIWVLSIRMSNKRIKWLLIETFNIMSKSYFQRLQLFLWECLNQNGNVQDSKAWESWEFVILMESTLLITKYIVAKKMMTTSKTKCKIRFV